MRRIKINGNNVNIPTNWGDLSFNQAIEIFDKDMSNIDVFSMFTGIPVDKIRSEKNVNTVNQLMYGLPFLKEFPDKSELPISVKIDDVVYNLPFALKDDMYDVGDAPVGCIEDIKEVIYQKTREIIGDDERGLTPLEEIKLKPYIVGLYLSSIMGEYDFKAGMKLADKVSDQISFLEVNSIGNFFLKRLVASINGLKPVSPLRQWIKRIYKQVCKNLIRILDSMLP